LIKKIRKQTRDIMVDGKKVCCFTGHRDVVNSHAAKLCCFIDEELEALIADGYTVFRTGGALGFDTIAALRVLLMKKKYDFITLELCLPCKDQTAKWKNSEKYFYNYCLKYADRIRYVGERYRSGCMFARNRMLVDGSDCCLGYCDPAARSGGSRYTLNYAKEQGVECRNIYLKF
jgi:uncharacterized phage-like protein YoqJ